MGYFTARERSALGKSIDERPQSRPREFARDEYTPRRRPAGTDVATLVQQLRDGSVAGIDALIVALQQRREAIVAENARMHRDIIAYAKFNQSTMDASRVISDSLSNLVRRPAAPVVNAVVEAVSDASNGNGSSQPSAESGESSEVADAPRSGQGEVPAE
jgi:hypothetical protein